MSNDVVKSIAKEINHRYPSLKQTFTRDSGGHLIYLWSKNQSFLVYVEDGTIVTVSGLTGDAHEVRISLNSANSLDRIWHEIESFFNVSYDPAAYIYEEILNDCS
ncbi:MAG: hypothetical protein DRQ48_03870 [Gammaproteobacteria bacterium]|nr:MAG: hypothetical protein DRQ48_03870 [Gammaproteobacteria bacterium]